MVAWTNIWSSVFFPPKTESFYCFRWIPRGCHKRWFGKSMLPLLRHLASAQITVQSMQKRLYLPGRQKVSLFTQPGACFWQRVKTLETKRNLWVYWRKNMQVCKGHLHLQREGRHETAFTLLNSPRFHVPSHSSNLTNKTKQNKKVEIKTALLWAQD